MQKITELEGEKGNLEQSYIDEITSLKDKYKLKINVHMEIEAKLRKEIDKSRKEVYASNNRLREIEESHLREISELKAEIEKLKTKTNKCSNRNIGK